MQSDMTCGILQLGGGQRREYMAMTGAHLMVGKSVNGEYASRITGILSVEQGLTSNQ